MSTLAERKDAPDPNANQMPEPHRAVPRRPAPSHVRKGSTNGREARKQSHLGQRGNYRKDVGEVWGAVIELMNKWSLSRYRAYHKGSDKRLPAGKTNQGAARRTSTQREPTKETRIVKLLKGLVVVLAIATAGAVALSIVAPNLLSSVDVQGFISSPAESLQNLADKGTSKITEAAGKAVEKAGNEAVSKMVDQSGLKEAAAAELHARAGDIAALSGLDESMVDYVIDSMDIPSWQTTTLPDGLGEQASIPVEYSGANATLTTYNDPSYMTVSAYGQDITFAVPDAAQGYIPYLAYL